MPHARAEPALARGFGIKLVAIAGLGLAWRAVYVVASRHRTLPKDGAYFDRGANLLADGKGFIDPFLYVFAFHARIPAAVHPPAWTAVLSVASLVRLDTTLQHQLFACVIGASTIVIIGFAGRRIAGSRAGLVAAGIAAVYAGFWSFERSLLSETLVLPSVAFTILCAYRYLARPGLGRVVVLGACCGVLTLQRSELLLLTVLLLAPLVLRTNAVDIWRRIGWLSAGIAVCVAIVAPWIVYNNSRFRERVFVATNTGTTLSAANCDSTYYGDLLGYRDYACTHGRGDFSVAVVRDAGGDGSVLDARLRAKGRRYIDHHMSRLPVVVAAREGRVWGFYRPFQQIRLDARDSALSVFRLAFVQYWLLAGAAIIGAVLLWRRRVPVWPLLSVLVTVAISVALAFGYTRYRAPADVSIVLLAAVAIDAGIARLRPSRRSAPAAAGDPAGGPAELVGAGTT